LVLVVGDLEVLLLRLDHVDMSSSILILEVVLLVGVLLDELLQELVTLLDDFLDVFRRHLAVNGYDLHHLLLEPEYDGQEGRHDDCDEDDAHSEDNDRTILVILLPQVEIVELLGYQL
jgi:hypothetical protein